MSSPLLGLGRADLLALAEALESGRLGPPFTHFALGRFLGKAEAVIAAPELSRLADLGMGGSALAATLRLLVEERGAAVQARDGVELVWTGPEAEGAQSRDTAVVVRDLFARAERSVLVATFSVYQGTDVFRALANRMKEVPALSVRMFVNVGRATARDDRPAAEILARFAEDFRQHQWPGDHLPDIYFDPRAVAQEPKERAALHAKCIVIDGAEVLVTSANFTEAAQQRNIEAGVLVRDHALAREVVSQFETLVEAGLVQRVPGL